MTARTKPRKHVRTGRPRGHWPAGKRRNNESAWKPIAAAVRLLVRDQISIRSLAIRLEVSDRTVRRWLSGSHVPGHEYVAPLKRELRRYGLNPDRWRD